MTKGRFYKCIAWLQVFAVVFSLGSFGNPAEAMTKSKNTAAVKSVSLKIGNR